MALSLSKCEYHRGSENRRVLFVNSLDERYGSTYRLRALRKSLANLPGVTTVISEANASAVRKLFVALRAAFGRYDILVTQKFNPITVAALIVAGLRRRARIVDWDDLEEGWQRGRFRRCAARACERLGPRLADLVTTHSPAIGERLKRRGAHYLHVPQGFDADLFRPDAAVRAATRRDLGFSDEDRIVGHLCTLTRGGAAHLETIVRTWAKLEEPSIRFLLVGGGPLDGWADRLLAAYGISKRVVRTGLVPHEKIPGLLQSMDVGVIYMSDSEADQARVSFKVLEYLALNIPVVGRVSGETRRLFGTWIDHCERENFADTIRAVLERKSNRSGSADLAQYAWDRATAPFRDAVAQLCKER
ncbi:MAG: glycosyltransferase [Pseudomonadota bacterium]